MIETEVGEEKQHPAASGKAQMNAMQITSPRKIEMQDIIIPQPKKNEVLFKVEGCGMCASTIPKWQGRDWFNYPLSPGDPGHEAYGIVKAVGSEVHNVKPGDRIAALSQNALAEYDIAAYNELVKLPPELDGKPFPGEPLGCAMNIFERSDIKPGHRVAIVGVGFLGALLIQLAKKKGAEVIAISRRPYSLQLASEMGADHVIAMDDHYEIIEKLKNISSGEFCDRVIECTGVEWPLNLSGELTKTRGKLVVAGFHQGGMRQVNMQLWNWRGLDVINAHERNPQRYVEGMEKAIKASLNGDWNYETLLTHFFPATETAKAFQMLEERPEGFVKGIIKFEE